MDAAPPDRLDVLVVDDDGSVATLVRAILEREGLVVGQVADARQALATLASTPCAVVLTDYTMPETNGLQLVRAAEAQGAPPAFLVMSAFLEPSVLAALIEEPAVAGVLGKPFDLSALVRDVRALLRVGGAGVGCTAGQARDAREPATDPARKAEGEAGAC